MKEREYRTIFTATATPEKFGKQVLVEEQVSMSIEQMYTRMLQTGELQNAMRQNVTGFSSKQAEAMIMSAKESPLYMRQGDYKKISDKIIEVKKMYNDEKSKEEIENYKKSIIEQYETIKKEALNE